MGMTLRQFIYEAVQMAPHLDVELDVLIVDGPNLEQTKAQRKISRGSALTNAGDVDSVCMNGLMIQINCESMWAK